MQRRPSGRLAPRRGCELADLVEDLSVILQGLKPVREILRHVQHLSIRRSELDAKPFRYVDECGLEITSTSKIAPRSASDEFGFLVRRELIMKTAEGPAQAVVGEIGLHETGGETVRAEFALAPRTRKEAAFILPGLWFDHECTSKLGGVEDHLWLRIRRALTRSAPQSQHVNSLTQ